MPLEHRQTDPLNLYGGNIATLLLHCNIKLAALRFFLHRTIALVNQLFISHFFSDGIVGTRYKGRITPAPEKYPGIALH